MCHVKIAVYTSITASKDSLKAPRVASGADFILFSDQLVLEELSTARCWSIRPACKLFADPRRNSRVPKILAHQYVADYDYSVWIDGSVRLLASARSLVENYLDHADIALFRHSARECLYDEAETCTALHLDDPAVIETQVAKYRREGFPAKRGLNECTVILRRHSALMESFNNAWWSEYCRHSCRDQLSFNYVLHKLGLRLALLPGTIHDNPGLISFEGHLRY
jgi:hypothetical protein